MELTKQEEELVTRYRNASTKYQEIISICLDIAEGKPYEAQNTEPKPEPECCIVVFDPAEDQRKHKKYERLTDELINAVKEYKRMNIGTYDINSALVNILYQMPDRWSALYKAFQYGFVRGVRFSKKRLKRSGAA